MTDAESIVHQCVLGASKRPFSHLPRSKVKTSFGLLLASSDPLALQIVGGLEVLWFGK
jgi:hypothetical protein